MLNFRVACESAKQFQRAASIVRVRLVRAHDMIALMALTGAALGGFAGTGVWAIVLAAIALAAISRAEYHSLYKRAAELGLQDAASSTSIESIGNAVIASGVAYAGGYTLSLF